VFQNPQIFPQRVRFSTKRSTLVGQRHGVPQEILQVFINILYENVFQNPEIFPTQVCLSLEQSTLFKTVLY
jgi:hypothetical protein